MGVPILFTAKKLAEAGEWLEKIMWVRVPWITL